MSDRYANVILSPVTTDLLEDSGKDKPMTDRLDASTTTRRTGLFAVAVGAGFLIGCGTKPVSTPVKVTTATQTDLPPLPLPDGANPNSEKKSSATLVPPPPQGISESGPINRPKNGDTKQTDKLPAVETPPKTPDLVVTSPDGFVKAMRDLATSQGGRHVVVDAWATWCVPCIQKFPEFVKLANARTGSKMVFASVSVDTQEDKSKAQKFLTDQKASFNHYLVEDVDQLQQKLDFSGVPSYFLFDPEGKLIGRFEKLEKLQSKLDELKLTN